MKENSIEEAIKTMEHWIEYEKNNKEKINKADELINIQETILLEYKKILKENKELNNRCKNLDEEAQAYVEELMGDSTLKDRIINRLNKENEELKNDYENLSNSVVVKNHCIKNSIPIQKIKDKIEELENANFNDYTKEQDGNNIKMEILYEFKKMLESEE